MRITCMAMCSFDVVPVAQHMANKRSDFVYSYTLAREVACHALTLAATLSRSDRAVSLYVAFSYTPGIREG